VKALAYVYSRANEAEALQAKVLTDDEARRIAANIAKLPTLLIAGGVIGRADATIIQMRGINRRHPTSDHEQNLTHRRHDDQSGS
jgi:hypothetical protein